MKLAQLNPPPLSLRLKMQQGRLLSFEQSDFGCALGLQLLRVLGMIRLDLREPFTALHTIGPTVECKCREVHNLGPTFGALHFIPPLSKCSSGDLSPGRPYSFLPE